MIITKKKGTFLPESAFHVNRKFSQSQMNYSLRLTKHKVYDLLLSFIENKEIITKNGVTLPFTSAPANLYHKLDRIGEAHRIIEKRIVSIPNFILNACLCEALQREFSQDEILSCNGFIKICGFEGNGADNSVIRLNFYEKFLNRYSSSGFMRPIQRNGLIKELKVYRHLNDRSPFCLNSTLEDAQADG